jgi:ribosomal protein L37AE/L43A
MTIVERMSDALVGKRVCITKIDIKYALLLVGYDEEETEPEAIAAMEAAEKEAETTCERCGAPGVMREDDNGWAAVRCDAHAEGAEPISERYEAEILAIGRRIAERDAEALRKLAE